jgi:hypothetical protein
MRLKDAIDGVRCLDYGAGRADDDEEKSDEQQSESSDIHILILRDVKERSEHYGILGSLQMFSIPYFRIS